MISKTYLRYIWLLDTISCSRIPLTYDHIVRIWEGSPYAYMGGLPIRTFHEHRKSIEEMFGVIIECDKSKGYTLYQESRSTKTESLCPTAITKI